MKKIEVNGLGVLVEVWKRKDEMSDIETMKEAIKTLTREVVKRETSISSGNGRTTESN